MQIYPDGTYTLSQSSLNIGGFDTANDFNISGHAYIKNIVISNF